MPSESLTSAGGRENSAFKPVRPGSKQAASRGKRPRKSAESLSSQSSELEEDEYNGNKDPGSPDQSQESLTTGERRVQNESVEPPPVLPPDLLKRLLAHHFKKDDTQMSKDANLVAAKYVETFVREAIARACHERSQAAKQGKDGDFLDTEDLEKLAPQLLLDF